MNVEIQTGDLFGGLWPDLSQEEFDDSVKLWNLRSAENGFDQNWIKGKKCLDAGCGSGRYSAALALNGAKHIDAIDISERGITEARKRTQFFQQIKFHKASVMNLPFEDASYDFVLCAGVIHHTLDFNKSLNELVRVLKPGGKLFLLVYGTGGIRWNAITALRPLVSYLGIKLIDQAIKLSELPSNSRKHFLDDLFVPVQLFTKREELIDKFNQLGTYKIKFWEKESYDHEASNEAILQDLLKLKKIMEVSFELCSTEIERYFANLTNKIINIYLHEATSALQNKILSPSDLREFIIGTGNIRLIADKLI